MPGSFVACLPCTLDKKSRNLGHQTQKPGCCRFWPGQKRALISLSLSLLCFSDAVFPSTPAARPQALSPSALFNTKEMEKQGSRMMLGMARSRKSPPLMPPPLTRNTPMRLMLRVGVPPMDLNHHLRRGCPRTREVQMNRKVMRGLQPLEGWSVPVGVSQTPRSPS